MVRFTAIVNFELKPNSSNKLNIDTWYSKKDAISKTKYLCGSVQIDTMSTELRLPFRIGVLLYKAKSEWSQS